MKKIVVKNQNDRIDKYLVQEIDESRATIVKMIESGNILLNGQVVKPSSKIKENDVIEYNEDFTEDIDIEPVNMDLNIIYEDADILVINKPSGLVVHPGSGNYSNTLVNGLVYHIKDLSDVNGEMRPGIVHRIDKDTSGILLVAKNNKVHNILAEDFKNKKIKREYIALLNGVFPHENATIDAPIGRDPHDRKKMKVVAQNSKEAVTHLKVLNRFKENTLVSLILDTGRTHQIRVHMKYVDYPVYNDPVYSNKSVGDFGQYLHSWKIDFEHPIRKEKMYFEVDVPEIFKNKIIELEKSL